MSDTTTPAPEQQQAIPLSLHDLKNMMHIIDLAHDAKVFADWLRLAVASTLRVKLAQAVEMIEGKPAEAAEQPQDGAA